MNLVIDRPFHLKPSPRRAGGYRLKAVPGHEPPPEEPATDRVHPLARCMALAIETKRLIESGVVADAAEIALVAGVTRARVSQVLKLTMLAPDIQEAILFLRDKECVDPKQVQAIALRLLWDDQRQQIEGQVPCLGASAGPSGQADYSPDDGNPTMPRSENHAR